MIVWDDSFEVELIQGNPSIELRARVPTKASRTASPIPAYDVQNELNSPLKALSRWILTLLLPLQSHLQEPYASGDTAGHTKT